MEEIVSFGDCEDPIQLKEYLKHEVELVSVGGRKHLGRVYTIDPISKSVILTKKENQRLSIDIVMGHCIKSIKILSTINSDSIDSELFTPIIHVSKEIVKYKKIKLKEWLEKHRIPIEEDGDILKLKDAVEITPPYGVEQCFSLNQNVLRKIQDIMLSMPEEDYTA